MSYKRFDTSTLTFKDKPISLQEALNEVEPFEWDDEVINGEKKVIISRQAEEHKECVKLGI